ncbi:MAG: 2Fe-2S iron-sulfur cluster-binding protein [Gammaproteobacteria bacterium]|nr:2Fe-2S iron-sulfur cluster-binding protein [Gammaproteobacteria bacterium]
MGVYRIRLLPSGHEFQAAAQENLLDAALRSGLNVNFYCSSGSCGECRARLIEGELGPHDFHDYHFSEAQKRQGLFLLCTAHAASDLVVEAGEARSPRDIPHQFIKARLGRVERVGEQLLIVQLRTPRSSPLRFFAGQHVALSIPGVGGIDCSIASCPCNGRLLQFHIPRQPDNPFVAHLFSGLRHGSEVEVAGPFGEMTLDNDSTRPLLLVAQDHELATMKSLAEHAINLDLPQPVRLIWLAREGRHYLENLCRSWSEALDDYHFYPLVYAAGASEAAQVTQLMAVIGSEIAAPGEWDIYWAGSSGFNQILYPQLLAAGADERRLFSPRRRAIGRMV